MIGERGGSPLFTPQQGANAPRSPQGRRIMTRRPAVTLIEVLVTLFIMSIGMLALLVLFPLGAISMGQALKDDRCASTAQMAENVAIALNVRHDPAVLAGFGVAGAGTVYVDPYGAIQALPPVGGVIPRVSPSFAASLPLADRWFSLPDDIAFSQSATPDTTTTGGIVDRGRRYSYAYLLTRLQPGVDQLVNLTVVVYGARPVTSLAAEPTFQASGTQGGNGILVNAAGTTIRRGGWVLDPVNGIFYRVTNLADTGAGSTVVDVSPNLKANIGNPAASQTGPLTVMDDAAEIFDKGTSWQP